ncbi:hypothetical protein RhiirA1_466766 [Rhizophagus irregularis]|uniref:Uncharacterized protein n=1 Tax=Rhizophagus irregularis TaxID=588596 RepID=A0A2N0RDA6_9GLOM|nr:hypothetical protein RhiirA1_466766 [Rhizophagus irregularis]
MDNHLGIITPYNNLRILSKGYQQGVKFTGAEMRDVMKIIVFVLDELYTIDNGTSCIKLIKCYIKFIKINLQLPKLHMWRYHTIHTIKRYRSLNGLATDTYETLHKNWVKNPYKMTNKKNVLDQMLKTIHRQEIITNVKKTHVSKLETMKSLLWKLPISDLQALWEKLEYKNSVDELYAYLKDKFNVTECEDIYLKIYATGVLSNNKIIYATSSKFHNNAKFSDIAIAMDNVDYLTDDGLCYGKILIIAEILFLPNYYPIFPIVLVHWYDYYSKRHSLKYGCPHMKLVNQFDIIPFNSIAGLIHMESLRIYKFIESLRIFYKSIRIFKESLKSQILRDSEAIYKILKDPCPKKFTDEYSTEEWEYCAHF